MSLPVVILRSGVDPDFHMNVVKTNKAFSKNWSPENECGRNAFVKPEIMSSFMKTVVFCFCFFSPDKRVNYFSSEGLKPVHGAF